MAEQLEYLTRWGYVYSYYPYQPEMWYYIFHHLTPN